MFERSDYISFANCGLPYHIGETIKDRNNLLVQTVKGMKDRFGIDVRVKTEVLKINPKEKTVLAKNLVTGEKYEESYDKLLLSPGAEAFIPPIPGVHSKNIYSLRNMSDMDKIKSKVDKKVKKAVVIGVVFALLLTGKYLSMPAIMGIILLTGIAVNDSIHLIDFAIEAKKEGLSPKDAMIEAGKTRFRPILMTTFSTTVGMLPLALELAIGAEKYSPLATVVIGGLTSSTLLLLFIVPVVYTSFEELKNRRTKIW